MKKPFNVDIYGIVVSGGDWVKEHYTSIQAAPCPLSDTNKMCNNPTCIYIAYVDGKPYCLKRGGKA